MEKLDKLNKPLEMRQHQLDLAPAPTSQHFLLVIEPSFPTFESDARTDAKHKHQTPSLESEFT